MRLLVVPLVLVGLAFSAVTANASAMPPPPSHPVQMVEPVWVKAASPHVRVINHIAKLISTKGLSKTTLRHTRAAIAAFNRLPLSLRRLAGVKFTSAPAALSVRPDVVPPHLSMRACAKGSYAAVFWWGIWLKASECLTTAFQQAGDGIVAIAGLIAVIAAIIPGGQVLATVSGFFAGAVAVVSWGIGFVDWFDCHNKGVSINATFAALPYLGC